ncbi:MAG: FAD-dependent oxidoreductase [Desulfobacteraceae bacterium]|nr:MAG: FAD-dependent oxidoreductase [Desulfobacteraceae bacterium]
MVIKENKKIGAVLVQGGGIAGVQASLDLANAGFKVYLVERSAAIGGMMSHLDKTFPTGDCATCIVSPKLVECSRNLNINILTHSELLKIEGEPGHFTASVKQSPRYVDENICNDCGDCTRVCPVDVPDRFNRNLGSRKAIAKYSAQAIPNIVGIQKLGHAPCKIACPANINVQGYIQLIKKKEYAKAVAMIRERNPLSAICGRVCTHPCEAACTRSSLDSAVAIRQLKRFASDKEMEMIESGELSLPEEKTPALDAKKVAVIGAGPSGLTTAQDLADRGYAVTVYEASPAAGGMLRWGIPEYRLPVNILDYEVELIRRKGVTFRYNTMIGKDISFEKITKEHDAVFIGIGTQKGVSLKIEGETLEGVEQGLAFLRKASTENEKPALKGHVIVVGGGDVAMDAACTAIRLGAEKVSIVYRRSEKELPAIREEINHAVEEGVHFEFLTAPVECISSGSNKLEKVRCIRMKLGEPDDSGRRRPVPIQGSEFEMAADKLILAIGSEPDTCLTESAPDLTVNKWGNIEADHNCITKIQGVFAGGDIVTGAATVIEAVAAGKRAAESIDGYIRGADTKIFRFQDTLKPIPEELLPSVKDIIKKPRASAKELPVAQRIKDFSEIETCFSEEDALAECERCLNCALCSECNECVNACEKKAIVHNMQEKIITLDIGSIILAPGFQEFDAKIKGEFGFGRYANVLTSVQFERMLSAAGPYHGHVIRPSDKKEVKRIAFIQCVGSRDSKCHNEYCSSICCMATTKQAMVASEHVNGLDVTIFYMDIRAFGKDFDQYYERAKAQGNIHYIKSMPSRVVENPKTRNLMLSFIGDYLERKEEDFDMVVLSVGLDPKPAVSETISRLGIRLNEFGFCATDRLNPLQTSLPGVFVAGAFQEPKDIPETVTQASAAASMSMEQLFQARNKLVTKREYPEEHDITDEIPRIGVFVCHCGINIASTVDVEKVTMAVSGDPHVVLATHTMYACSDASLSEVKEAIMKHRLNRIVVASCTPRTHEPLFRETLREAGLNPYLFELANIRDQCSWVHASEPEAATEKAIELVRMSLSRARLLKPQIGESLAINQDGLVIGGGLSGMTTALSLANQGFKVHLVEKTGQLGGHLKTIHGTLEHRDISDFTNDLIERVKSHPLLNLHLETEVAGIAGHVGKFSITLSGNGNSIDVPCGAVIVATGADPAETIEFLAAESDNVITQTELEKRLHDHTFNASAQNITMIQCVGSRNDEREYCSRLCCSMAIKNALSIKKQNPDTNIFVLYRDIRTYGFRETYYKEARKAGVVFIRYDREKPPVVTNGGQLLVTIDSPDFPETIEIETDQVVLSTGIKPLSGNRRLSNMLKVPLNANGFYVEAHMKLRPVDFANEGIFLCGLAHSPKFMDENMSQARAAAARAATVLSKTHLEVGAQVSKVDQSKCISCMTCVHSCPYGAPFINKDHKGEIAAAKCMGCGICASECPARAIQLNHFEARHFKAMLDELFQKNTDLPN